MQAKNKFFIYSIILLCGMFFANSAFAASNVYYSTAKRRQILGVCWIVFVLLIAASSFFAFVKTSLAADRLLQPNNMTYQGAFTLPNNGTGENRVSYSQCVVGFNSATRDTLFVTGAHLSGTDYGPMHVAEVRIPESLYTGTSLSTLNSSYATSFVLNGSTCNNATTGCYYELTGGNYNRSSLAGGTVSTALGTSFQVTGMVVDNGSLLASYVAQYDNGGQQALTLFRHSHTNLADSAASYVGNYGLNIGSLASTTSFTGGGVASGAMNPIPQAYQDQLGGKYFITGNSLQRSAIGHSSYGPTATVFDSDNLSSPGVMPGAQNAIVLLGYPAEHPTLGVWATGGAQTEYYSDCDHFAGAVLPAGSHTLLVIGVHGKSDPGDTTTVPSLGCAGASSVDVSAGDVAQNTATCSEICYQSGISTPVCSGTTGCYDIWGSGSSNVSRCHYDPSGPASQGPHCWPYVHQVWAYDVGNTDGTNTTGNNVQGANANHPEMNNLTAVRLGYIQPWELYPYSMWELPSHFYSDPRNYTGDLNGTYGQIYSVSYDPETGRLYAGIFYGQGWNAAGNQMPVVESWQITAGSEDDTMAPGVPTGLAVR